MLMLLDLMLKLLEGPPRPTLADYNIGLHRLRPFGFRTIDTLAYDLGLWFLAWCLFGTLAVIRTVQSVGAFVDRLLDRIFGQMFSGGCLLMLAAPTILAYWWIFHRIL